MARCKEEVRLSWAFHREFFDADPINSKVFDAAQWHYAQDAGCVIEN